MRLAGGAGTGAGRLSWVARDYAGRELDPGGWTGIVT